MSSKKIDQTIITCDRCGYRQTMEGCNELGISYAHFNIKTTFPSCGDNHTIDLCDDCWNSFLDFVHPSNKGKKK